MRPLEADLRAAPLHHSLWRELGECLRQGNAEDAVQRLEGVRHEMMDKAPAEALTRRTAVVPVATTPLVGAELHAQLQDREAAAPPPPQHPPAAPLFEEGFDISRFADLRDIVRPPAAAPTPSASRKRPATEQQPGPSAPGRKRARPPHAPLLVALSGSLSTWRWRYTGDALKTEGGWAYFNASWIAATIIDGTRHYQTMMQCVGRGKGSAQAMRRNFDNVIRLLASTGTGRAVCAPLALLEDIGEDAKQLLASGMGQRDDTMARDLAHLARHGERVLLALTHRDGKWFLYEGWHPQLDGGSDPHPAGGGVEEGATGLPLRVDCEVEYQSLQWGDLKG